jgi:hypothetical protein
MGASGASMGGAARAANNKSVLGYYGALGSMIRQKIAQGPTTGRKYNTSGGNVLGPGESITPGKTLKKGRNPLGFALALDSQLNPDKFKAAGLSIDSQGRIRLPATIRKKQNNNTKLGSGV